jgi:hypothetical protein
MATNLNKEQWLARAEAYFEAAEHLGQAWTDNPEERTQGDIVSCRLRDISNKCFERADAAPATPRGPITLAGALKRSLRVSRC